MYRRASWIVVFLFAFAPGLAGAPALAQQPIVVKLGTVAPEGTPWAKQVEFVRKLYKKEAKGRLKLKEYLGFSKGGEKSLVRRCVQGSIQMCGITIGALSTVVEDLAVLELPYLFDSNEEADRILDGPALPQVKKILAAKGLVFYGWSENGWRGFGTKTKPIRKPADLKGLKMRSQENAIHVQTYKALGANPVPIALPEVLGALQTGVVDGYDNSPLYLFAASWYHQTKYYTLTDHIYQPAIIAYNKRFFDKLPADLKAIASKESHAFSVYGRKLIRKINEPLLQNMRSAGIKVIKISPAERAAFVKATAKIQNKIRRTLSPAGRKLLDIILKAKKAKGK
jgi:tripartite ATP-independent transporter DctP family solute receptor